MLGIANFGIRLIRVSIIPGSAELLFGPASESVFAVEEGLIYKGFLLVEYINVHYMFDSPLSHMP